MNNNHPPFRVGQRVVYTTRNGFLKHEHEAIVIDCRKCKCGTWYIDVGIVTQRGGTRCGECPEILNISYAHYSYASSWRPIDPLYNDITKELAGKGTTEETPDVVRVRELN